MRPRRFLYIVLLPALAGSCSAPPSYRAEVRLQIDNQAHDYRTEAAQIDEAAGDGKFSVYLRPQKEDRSQPYVCYRVYGGNPVTHLWLRFGRREHSDELAKYECFVPGRLRDGRPTLGWTDAEGKARDKTETGQPDCQAAVRRTDGSIRLTFDALLHREQRGKKSPDTPQQTVRARGEAIVRLP
jgi:hypothetical protein